MAYIEHDHKPDLINSGQLLIFQNHGHLIHHAQEYYVSQNRPR